MVRALLLGAVLLGGCAAQPAKSPATAAPPPQIEVIASLREATPYFAPRAGESVLVVFDVDDTLLTSPHFFGSDRWVSWQFDAATPSQDKFACLFDIVAINYEAGTQHVTEAAAPAVVAASTGDTLILTSRSPAARNATLRELDRAGIGLPKPLGDGRPRSFAVKDKQGRDIRVGYDNGIFMVAGQNKGELLDNLLGQLGLKYDRIVLVDDGSKNLQRVADVFRDKAAFVGLRYVGVKDDTRPLAVTPAEIDEARATRRQLDALLALAYPERAAAMANGECWEK